LNPVDSDLVLLDTAVFSYLLNGHQTANAYRRHVEGKRFAVSFITVGELLFGALRRSWGQIRIARLKIAIHATTTVPWDEEICDCYAETKAQLESKGTPIADNDLWIAACALRHSMPLVSHNRKHFIRISGLTLISEDTTEPNLEDPPTFPYVP
jgi:tRNA(fMet)-specific endonuclease VapC